MTMSGEALARKLQEQTYAAVPFPMQHAEIAGKVETFFRFLELSQEEKDRMVGKRVTDTTSDIGYVRTKGEKGEDNGNRDFKEYFHYHPDAQERWAREAATDPRVGEFFRAADEVYRAADATGKSVLRELSEVFPGLYDAFYPSDRPMERILRFLKYDSRGEGQFLARAHYDRGGCTLAIAESAPGLRIGKDADTLTPVVHKDGTAIFFAAPHLSELTKRKIMPAWHDVLQASGDTVSSDAARWAVVYFMNAPALAFPSSEETHRPLI